jgi:hypothetical protein
MGIETIIAIAAVAAAGASTGYQATAAHEAKVDATHEKNDQIAAQSGLQQEAKNKEKQNLFNQAGVVARARQRAMAASYGTAGPGVQTNPLGAVGQPDTASKTLLGQ